MPFHAWKSNLLRNRELKAPDGRHLYAYRLKSGEFRSLEALLKNRLAHHQQAGYRLGYGRPISLGLISEQVSGFPALFVLYAAEWWRQRYDGSGWSWQPILRDLGVNPEDWNASERSTCITKGLQDWGLSPRESGGLRYLGTIALQGGLPMRLLAEARGGVGNLLRGVLKEATRSKVTVHDIQGWVQSLEGHLPRTYRQPEIHVLLAQVVATVLHLKEEAELTQSDDAIARLEQRVPSWRERFPLPVNDANARGLIEQLIRDAAAARIERQAILFRVERALEQDSDGLWHLRSSLILPDKDNIESAKLERLFAEEPNGLPRLLDMTLVVAGRDQTLSLRRLAGHDKYRIQRRPCGASDRNAADEHILRLSAADGRIWNSPAPRGEELDDDLPWVFDAREESPPLLRQGAGSVPTQEALAAVPPDWVAAPEAGGTVTLEGNIQNPKKRLYRIRGTVRFSAPHGESCRIRTGRADANEENYAWIGQRLWQKFIRPGMAFLGKPQLYQVDDEGRSQPITGEPCWRPLGANSVNGCDLLGPVEMRYPATGEVKHRARMVILRTDANLRLEFTDAGSGRIHLGNWGAISAHALSANMISETSRAGDNLTISLRVTAGQRAPEWVEFDVHWPHTPTAVRLRLPYPAEGARIYDANSHELRFGALLAANQLLGVRIHALGGDPAAMRRMSLEFRLNGSSKESSYDIFPPKDSIQLEIRLQDYAVEIAHLLANDDSPDATIGAVLRIGGKKATAFRIARYACRMERDTDRVHLDASGIELLEPDELAALSVMALRLEYPGEEVAHLTALTTEGVATGAWEFAPETREPGSWLIFPASTASLPFRPILWTISGAVAADGHIAQSIGITQLAERESALDTAIETIADDFLDSGWVDVDRLINQVGHLPLVTLDLWRRFGRSAGGMTALAIRFATLPSGFLERFAQELPFSWETVPFAAWRRAIEQLKQQCDSQCGAASEIVFKFHIGKRIDELSSLHPALTYLLGFARASALNEDHLEIRACRHPQALPKLNEILFSGDQSLLQRLLRNNADVGKEVVQWPTAFNCWVDEARQKPLSVALLCNKSDYRDGLINLPILLAIHVVTNATREWFEISHLIHDLRAHITFDSDWFTEAYNLSIARCLAAGLLKLETES